MNVLTTPEVIGSIDGLRERIAAGRAEPGGKHRTVLVPTMGALHAGHLALVRRARSCGDLVVVSIFVNPLQFGPREDLASYPRTLASDVAALAAEGVALVFCPSAGTMYPAGAPSTRVTAGEVGALYEGAARPGHFDGMLTVVAKLINIVGPDIVVFGQKDAQQVFLVQRMLADLDLRAALEVVPIVREAGGLALSSRNHNLTEPERRAARSLSAGLAAAAAAAGVPGGSGVPGAFAAARALIDAEPLVKLDYLVAVDPQTFRAVADDHRGPARLLVAAIVGGTRLIDNVAVDLP